MHDNFDRYTPSPKPGMKLSTLGVALLLAVLTAILIFGMVGCANPVRPTPTEAPQAPLQAPIGPVATPTPPPPTPDAVSGAERGWPLHHNIPFIQADGSVAWLCATQPRPYITAQGIESWEEDHYAQATSCPETPIQ